MNLNITLSQAGIYSFYLRRSIQICLSLKCGRITHTLMVIMFDEKDILNLYHCRPIAQISELFQVMIHITSTLY